MENPSFLRSAWLWLTVGIVLIASSLAYIVRTPAIAMPSRSTAPTPAGTRPPAAELETATLATGCFWCTQAVLQRLPGVWEVTCGYTGGAVPNPTYEEVCAGTTGHAEAVEVKFDPKVISYEELLAWFWRMHDPTTKDAQYPDEGPQYRSVIFYHGDAQKAAAQKSLAAAQKDFRNPIVTEIVPAAPFYSAEKYHQEYFNNNANQNYCRYIIAPKLEKLHLTLEPTSAGGAK